VTYIGSQAFHNAGSLVSVSLPSTLRTIEAEAFYNAESLSSITLPAGLTEIKDGAFANTKALASIAIPEGITAILPYTFADSGISSVTLPSTLTDIYEGGFYNTDSLTSVTLPAGLTSIGPSVFRYASNLATVNFEGNAPSVGGNAFDGVASGAKAQLASTSLTGFGYNGDSWQGLAVSGGLEPPDTTAPDAPTLSGVPASPTLFTTASIGISGEPGATFQCSVDGAPYAACTSPLRLTGLAIGDHTLSVTQTDAAANVSTPVSVGWTVVEHEAPSLLSKVGLKFNFKTRVTTLKLNAEADTRVAGNSIKWIEYFSHPKRPAANARQNPGKIRQYATTVVLPAKEVAFWVRVKDTKGKWSRWYSTKK
jgi:hypothetical protein